MSGFRGIFAVALLGLAAACGTEVIADVDGWADRACACKTTECALEIREAFTSWVEKERGVRGSRTEKVKIETSAKRLFKCLDAMKAADPPKPTPKPARPDAEKQAIEERAAETPGKDQPAPKGPATKPAPKPPATEPAPEPPATEPAPKGQ